MALVTLHSGRVVNLTPSNVDDALREQLASYPGTDSNFQAAQQEAFYKLAGVGYDTTARDESQALAQRVIDNPLASASKAVTDALPAGVSSVWSDTSNAVFNAGAQVNQGVRKFASDAWDNIKAVAGKIPHIADETNTTARILAISAAVIVVGGAAVYLTHKLKR